MSDLHKERTFEEAIEYDLVEYRGYQARSNQHFDAELCLNLDRVVKLLQEYRTALISEVVTRKADVRGDIKSSQLMTIRNWRSCYERN